MKPEKVILNNRLVIRSENLRVEYFEDFFDLDECNTIIPRLNSDINWMREKITMWGKKIITKRRIAWYGDEGRSYTYSGTTFQPSTWNQILLRIKDRVESKTSHKFNSVLLNDYKDGSVGMGWHSDDEKELGKNPIIASLSFGANRDFILKHREKKDIEKVKIHLKNGSLLLMLDSTQHYWKHSIPKRLKVKNSRINLTFRKIINSI